MRLHKKTWLLFGLFCLLVIPITPITYAQEDPLSAIETQLFAHTYATDSQTERLDRIETTMFGAPQTGTPDGRLNKIERIFKKNALASIAPQGTKSTPQQNQPPVHEATSYPAVTELEDHLFHQTYAQEDVAQRLGRLEDKVFHQTFDELPLVDRVDQLTLKVFPNGALGQEESFPQQGRGFKPSHVAVYSKLTALEEQLFDKSFGGELIIQRISRLEETVFGQIQTGDIDSRIHNLMANYQNAYVQKHTVGHPQYYAPQRASQPSTSRNIYDTRLQGRGQVAQPPTYQERRSYWELQTQQNSSLRPPLHTAPGQIYRGGQPPGSVVPYTPAQQGQRFPNTYSAMNATQPSMMKSLALLEFQVFGRSYEGAHLNTRLSNLERRIMGRTYPHKQVPERVNALLRSSPYPRS